jgi:chromosome segregation ATPase
MKLEEEFQLNTKNHEEEVQLRLKFESKLNNMHSIHRDVETKYRRALNEIENLRVDKNMYQEKMKQFQSDYLDTKRLKEEKEGEMEFKDEKIQLLTKENKLRKEQIDNLEKKLLGLQSSVEFKLNIEYIQSEAERLDFSKYQPEERVDIYETKFKELEEANWKIVEELQKLKRDKLGFEEILKEREERILRVKSLLTEIQNSHKILDKQHSSLKLDYERAMDNFNEQKVELEDTINKLKITNKARNENELQLNEEREKQKELKTLLNEKEDRIHKYINEIQKLEKQLFNLRKEKDSLDSEKSNESKHFEIQKRQYVEKITSLNEIIGNERETREMWVERFNKEQTGNNLILASNRTYDL